MLNRFLTSKKVKVVLFLTTVLFAAATVFAFMTPLNRKNEAIQGQGEETISQTRAFAATLNYYDAPRLEALIKMPTENPFYLNFCGLLARIKQEMNYENVYVLYYGIGGKIGYLADADFRTNGQPGTDFQPIGAEYPADQISKRSRSLLEDLFEGKRDTAYIPEILEGNRIISYLPIQSSNGKVIAVLGVEAILEYSDFSKFGPIRFETLATVSAILFVISLLLFLACLERARQEDDKNDKGKSHYGLKLKSSKKENVVPVDNLEDIDPEDYL